MGNAQHSQQTRLLYAGSPIFYFDLCHIGLYIMDRVQVLASYKLGELSLVIHIVACIF